MFFFVILFTVFVQTQASMDAADEVASGATSEENIADFLGSTATNPCQETIVDYISLPWNIEQHITKLAKEYIENCTANTILKINRNHGLGQMLGLKKSHRHKNKTTKKTLGWIAEKKDEVASYLSTLTNERDSYTIYIGIYDELQNAPSYIADETERERIFLKQIDLSIWLSTIKKGCIDEEVRLLPEGLAPVINQQTQLLNHLETLYRKNLERVTSGEAAIAFILKNVSAEHKEFFAKNRDDIAKYVMQIYYPEV